MLNVSIHVITALLLKNDYVVNSPDILTFYKNEMQTFLNLVYTYDIVALS